MEMIKKLVFTMLLGCCSLIYAQEKQYSWQSPPIAGEKKIGFITKTISGGHTYKFGHKQGPGPMMYDKVIVYSEEELYSKLLEFAKEDYPNYSDLSLRSFVQSRTSQIYSETGAERFTYKVSAIVVIRDPEELAASNLSRALEKALKNVQQESRLSIDQVVVLSGVNKDDYIDQLIDLLLEKGYRVVAKQYLQKLYEEQQNQKSGIFNEGTTVEENNFSAVGYYVNVRVTETSLRVQVINVSTGEYEGNATINY